MKNQAVELLPIDSVTPYQRNTRLHSQANIQKIAASIKEFGWTVPILVDEGGAILAGHGRLLAARTLSMPQVPCLTVPDLSSAQKRAYRLADNRLTLDSDWDWEALKLELGELLRRGDQPAVRRRGDPALANVYRQERHTDGGWESF